jgi:glycosyltransferase involved in cell wall biosynthesis
MSYQDNYSSRKRRGAVLMIGPLPPPLTGAALITERISDRLLQFARVKTANVSPVNLDRNWHYHFTRLSRMCVAFGLILRHAREFNAAYISLSGGLGQVYDLVLIAVARIFGYALFIHHHSFSYIDQRSLVFALIGRIAGYGALHICLCTHMETKLKATYGSVSQTITVSNAALVGSISRHHSPHRDVIVLGHMSNLTTEKGIDTVLKTAKQCIAAKLPVRLVLAGPVHGSSIQNLIVAAQAELGAALEYRGPVYGSEKEKFFEDIDIFLFPTRYENEAQPLVVLESLAAGVPVVAMARGCIADDLGDGGIATLGPEEFIRHVLVMTSQAAQSPDFLREASARASQRASTLEQISEQAFKVLASRIAATGSREHSQTS